MITSSDALVISYFRYYPNHIAAYVALPVFVLIDLFLIVRIVIQKAPSFMYKMIFFATAECIGIALRIVCFKTDISIAKFLVMTIFMLLPTNILTLIFYSTIANILTLSNIKSSKLYLKPKAITVFFIAGTVIPSLLQASGGISMLFNKTRSTGRKLSITGLSLQLCILLTFGAVLILITREKAVQYHIKNVDNPKKKVLIRIYTVLALMLIRVVYRFSSLLGSPSIASHEWPFYIFDVLVAAISFLVLSTLSSFLPRRGEEDAGTLTNDTEVEKIRI